MPPLPDATPTSPDATASPQAVPMFDFSAGLTADSLRAFFVWCAREGVSDIHLQGGDPIVVGLHGRLHPVSTFRLEDTLLTRLIDDMFTPEIKAMVKGGQSVDRALEIEGLNRGERLRFRANFVQATVGRQELTTCCTLRVLPSAIPALESLGLPADLMHALLPRRGIVWVGGQTGSGKTTLLAALYQYCGRKYPDKKIITCEDPVEYILGSPDCLLQPSQSQVGRDVSSFASGGRGAMRRAPSVIGVGETRDLETLEAALAAGQSSHLVLSTLHIDSVGECFPRCILWFPAEMREAAAHQLLRLLQVVVVQRLLRTTDGKRQAIREYLIFDDALRRALTDVHYSQWGRWIDDALSQKGARLADQAWALHQAGRIDRDEMIDATSWQEYAHRAGEQAE